MLVAVYTCKYINKMVISSLKRCSQLVAEFDKPNNNSINRLPMP